MGLSSRKTLSILKRSLMPDRPYHAQWLLTHQCNYRCRGCDVWRRHENVVELSSREIKRGLDILRKLGVIEIVFSGGNPLLREDIGEILEYASKHFITTVYDNGSMAVEKIDALKPVDFVAISLDTLNEDKNDYLKGVPGSWKKAMNAINTLHAAGIPVGVSPTISQVNMYEIVDFTKKFTGLGIPVWYCLYWYDFPLNDSLFRIGTRNNEFEIVDRETIITVFDTLAEMKKDRDDIYITNKTLTALKQFFLDGTRIWECKSLHNFLVIDPYGRVAGCHCQESVASIFELLDVWESKTFEDLRKQYNNCTKCAYLCYIFYSIHTSVWGNIEIVLDQWKNAKKVLQNEKRY